ncbi:MAG: glycosyltransferase [Nitrososphaerales archaeon]
MTPENGSGHPLVSVVVPTKNSAETIETCLESLRRQSYKSLEIIVVDNHSRDWTVQVAEKCGAKVYSKGPERSAQVNFGARVAGGKYVYRVDADFVVQPDVIKEAVESCENQGCDAVEVHNTSDATVSLWAQVRKLERDNYVGEELNVAARFWRRDAFLSVGGFDERLVAAEDYDLHDRLVRAGFKIGRIRSCEIHLGEPKTLYEVFRKHYYYGRSLREYIGKNGGSAWRQLSPMRRSYSRAARDSARSPKVLLGFVVYQSVRYFAALIGVISVGF